jgi:hypothetical protein
LQEVDELGSLILLKKQDKWAILDRNRITGYGKGVVPEPLYEYDRVEVEEDHMLAFRDDQIFLLDTLGFKVLNRGYQEISRRYDRWIFESEKFFEVAFNDLIGSVGPFEDVIYNEKFILGKRNDSWSLIREEDTLSFDLFEPRFFGSEFMIATHNDSLKLFVHPDSLPFYLEKTLPELLSQSGNKIDEDPMEYVLLEKRNYRTLISSTGRTIELGNRYETFQLQGNRYIIVGNRKGLKGILDLKGKEILKPRYEGIGNFKEGYLALLKNKKFGLFGGEDETLIAPVYDIAPERIAPGIFKVRKGSGFGLIDKDENMLLDFEYDDIRFWNDTVFWLKKDFRWLLYELNNKEELLEDVKDFKELVMPDEELFMILTGTGYGVISNKRGMIVPPVYSDLRYFSNQDQYTYFCEKHIEEALFYVLIYIGHEGNIIKKQAFEEENYERIYCDDY